MARREVRTMSITKCPWVSVVVVVFLTSLPASRCPGGPPAKASSADSAKAHSANAAKASSADAAAIDAVAKDIEKTARALGYSTITTDELVSLVRGWKCEQWKEKLSKARAGNTAEVAGVEEEVVKGLSETIGKQIAFDAGSQYFHLSKVVEVKKANGFGYSQLFYVLGNSIGLNVTVINVLELASGPPSAEEARAACSVSLSDGRLMIVDVAQHFLSKPFVFKETFGASGYCWELKQKDNPLGIPRRIQFSDESGLVGMIYDSVGDEYGKKGIVRRTIAYCTKAIDLNPTYSNAYVHRGAAYGKVEESENALTDFATAIRLDPKCAEAYANRGAHYNDLGQYKQVIPDCTKAIALKPSYTDAYVHRGIAYSQLNQPAKAIADLAKAIDLNPTMAEAFLARGTVYDKLGHHAVAIADYDKAIDLNPRMAQGYFNRGIAHGKLKQPAKAVIDFTRVLAINPKMAEAYLMRAVANATLNDAEAARADLRRAEALNPDLSTEVKKISTRYKLRL
jgi:tetratricopeptide (TPR) repeat protein